jgi:hypothetical protein
MRKSTLALVAALTLPLTGAHSAPPVETHTAREASAYNQALHDIAAACAQTAAVKYVIQLKGGEQIAITMECRVVDAERRKAM